MREDVQTLMQRSSKWSSAPWGEASPTFPGQAKCLEDKKLKARGSTNQKGKVTH